MKVRLKIITKPLLLSLTILQCCKEVKHTNEDQPLVSIHRFTAYSNTIKDTFHISVQIPLDYQKNISKHYGVIVLTDANFYFPMLAPILHQYEKGGLLPPLILVGVGYKSLNLMNSLRVRDYLYPKSIPSDEIKAPGGAQRYYNFITHELLPKIDSNFRTEIHNKILLGHSFGGYFSLFSLQQQLKQNRDDFKGFVAASPTLWYNNNYLFKLPGQLKDSLFKDTTTLYLTAGQLETPREWTIDPVQKMSKHLIANKLTKLRLNTVVYNNLEHMDAGLISFLNGIENMYRKPIH